MNTSYCTELDIYVTLDSIGPQGLQGDKGEKGDKGDTGVGGALGYYGSFFDTSDQYIATPNTPQVVQINSVGEASGISLGGNGKYVIENAGTYSMTFSIQLRNTDNVIHYADIWLKYNGEVYPDSNTRFHIPARKSTNESGYAVATVNFVGTAQNDNDYVELWWLTDDGSMVTMETLPASNGVPETPSVICTFAQVMYTQEGPQGPIGPVGPAGTVDPALILQYVYPVGSIYMSVNNVSPQSFVGGTWSAWGTGRVPVAVDTGQTEFNTVEKTGGHKLLQSHRHDQILDGSGVYPLTSGYTGGGTASLYPPFEFRNTTQYFYTTSYTGGGDSQNLQPYITCYMWKRTA